VAESKPAEGKAVDSLIKEFSEEQRKYIQEELYPLIHQTLLQFMTKSIETDHYKLKA